MKLIKKASVLLSILIFCITATACSDKSWAIKSDSETLSTGVYVFYLMQSYQEAYQKLDQEGKSTSDLSSEKIDDQSAPNWIVDKALNRCKDWIAVEKMFKEMNLSFSDEETTKANETTDSSWETYGSTYEKNFGISRNDFHNAVTLFNLKLDKIFQAIYGKDGTNAVSDDEINDFYKANYVSINFYSKMPYEETDTGENEENNNSETENKTEPESTQENSENKENNTESDSEKKKADTDESIQKEFGDYVEAINSGSQTIDQIRETIKKNEGITDDNDPLVSQVINQNSTSLSSEVSDAVKKLEPGKATYIKFNDVYLLLIKSSTPTENPDLGKDDERKNILYDMKYNDFEQKLKDKVSETKYDINYTAVNQYNPLMFSKLVTA